MRKIIPAVVLFPCVAFGQSLPSPAMNGANITVTAPGTTTPRSLAARSGDTLNVKDFAAAVSGGLIGTAKTASYAVTASVGSAAITLASGAFSSADVGKSITVGGIGAAGAALSSTIASVQSATQITLAANAQTAVSASSKTVSWGFDDYPAFAAAVASRPSGSEVRLVVPVGSYYLATAVLPNGRTLTVQQDNGVAVYGPGILYPDRNEYYIHGSKQVYNQINTYRSGNLTRNEQTFNNTVTGGVAYHTDYTSQARSGNDFGETRFVTSTATTGISNSLSLLNHWAVTVSPNTDASQLWSATVAEWDIVNRGPDSGYFADRYSASRPTGGLLVVSEAQTFANGGSETGNHNLFGLATARSGGINPNTGNYAAFYHGLLVERDSIVGVGADATGKGGRGVSIQGNSTGVSARNPYAAAELTQTWTHGIVTSPATFVDSYAMRLGAGQGIAWDVGTPNAATAIGSIRGSGSGTDLGITITPAGTGVVTAAGPLTATGNLSASNGQVYLGSGAGTSAFINMNGAAGSTRQITYQSGGATRWNLALSGSESGSNAGGDWNLFAYADNGGFLSNPVSVNRSTGKTYLLDAQVSGTLQLNKRIITSGSAPTVSACGTSPSITGNDASGVITMGTASPTACTITFVNAFGSAARCVANAAAAGAPVLVAPTSASSTAVTFTLGAATSSATVTYQCVQ